MATDSDECFDSWNRRRHPGDSVMRIFPLAILVSLWVTPAALCDVRFDIHSGPAQAPVSTMTVQAGNAIEFRTVLTAAVATPVAVVQYAVVVPTGGWEIVSRDYGAHGWHVHPSVLDASSPAPMDGRFPISIDPGTDRLDLGSVDQPSPELDFTLATRRASSAGVTTSTMETFVLRVPDDICPGTYAIGFSPEPQTLKAFDSDAGTVDVMRGNDFQIVIQNDAFVSDTVAPTIYGCPDDLTFILNAGNTSAVVDWQEPVAVDNCDVMGFEPTIEPGVTFQTGVTTVRYTATDGANTSICTFEVSLFAAPVLGNGWHAISLPVEMADASIDTVLPGRGAESIWTWHGGHFKTVDNLEIITGYFVFSGGSLPVQVSGEAVSAEQAAVTLSAGWNLVGPGRDAVAIHDVNVDSRFWTVGADDLTAATSMSINKGYWVFSREEASVNLAE